MGNGFILATHALEHPTPERIGGRVEEKISIGLAHDPRFLRRVASMAVQQNITYYYITIRQRPAQV